MYRLLLSLHYLFTAPISIFFILTSSAIHPAYRLSWVGKLRLGFTMALNKLRVPTGSSYKAHLAMALKILETPPEVEGDVVSIGHVGDSRAYLVRDGEAMRPHHNAAATTVTM